jgi:hypothetical protein
MRTDLPSLPLPPRYRTAVGALASCHRPADRDGVQHPPARPRAAGRSPHTAPARSAATAQRHVALASGTL